MRIEEIAEQKKVLRRRIKELKKANTKEESIRNSRNIFMQVETLNEFINSKTILAYWSLPDEVQTHEFVTKWSKTKQFALPLIVGETLELRLFSGLDNLKPVGSFGILEPLTGKLISPNDIDFAVIPGVAFDIKGNRLGRGKGYYDRILNQIKGKKVGVGFNFQIVENVPTSNFDIPVDLVISN